MTVQAESEGAAPLVAFTVDGKNGGGRRRGASRQAGVLARTLPGLDWVRVSLGYWVSDGDLERLAAALRPGRERGGVHARGE